MAASMVETTTEMRCSFCAKKNTEVDTVVAGPGVYICDECVWACVAVLEQEATMPEGPRVPAWATMTDEQILEHVPRIAAVEDQVERSLREWVGRLRARGVTWERIGSALGITRQSAWERFSGEKAAR